jgi:hypothetical protein
MDTATVQREPFAGAGRHAAKVQYVRHWLEATLTKESAVSTRDLNDGRLETFYIFAIITNDKHSKAILTIAHIDLPLLFQHTFTITLFTDVARHDHSTQAPTHHADTSTGNSGCAHAYSSTRPHMSGSSSTSSTLHGRCPLSHGWQPPHLQWLVPPPQG